LVSENKNVIDLQTNKDPYVKITRGAALTIEGAVSRETPVRTYRTAWCHVQEVSNSDSFFFSWFGSPSGPWPPHC